LNETFAADFIRPALGLTLAVRCGRLLEKTIFVALLLLIVLAAVAYGGSDPWWKSVFTCLIFGVGAFAAIELALSKRPSVINLRLLLPILVLIAFALVQTIPSPRSNGASLGISYRLWNAISADPYETKLFALHLTGLALFAGLLFRYAATESRLSLLIYVIIGTAVASALFGLLRATMQHNASFWLPFQTDQGYGQFVNRNHFAYLMEMGFGLLLGLIASGRVQRDKVLIYLGALVPIWMALVLSNSRGGILAMLVQLMATLLLFPLVVPAQQSDEGKTGRWIRSRSMRLVMVFSLVIMVAGGVLWVGGDRLVERIEATRGEIIESEQLRQGVTRIQIWQATLRMIEANPIAGVGMGGYWVAIPTFHEASGGMTPQQAHNDYLEILASGGIVGLAIVVWLAVMVLQQARLNLRARERFIRTTCFAALVAIVGVAVHSLVDFGLHRMANAMVFTALIVIVTSNVSTEKSRQSKDA